MSVFPQEFTPDDRAILVRGRNSTSASNSPLILWDGILFVGGISEINPNDVESIDVLKDASASQMSFQERSGITVDFDDTRNTGGGASFFNLTLHESSGSNIKTSTS